jgi:prephenate dehydrogenase
VRQFKTVTIVGVGMIGGSIGMALRRARLAERVVGVGRRQSSLRAAQEAGAVDHITVDLAKGVAEAELVVVCSPVERIVGHVREAAENCPRGTLLTDAGSTKESIVEGLQSGLARGCRFLGGHPLAGSEKAGPASAKADLFEGKLAVLTPTSATRAEDYDTLEQFWGNLGSVVVRMSAGEHDRAMGLTSHLPHAVAVALVSSLPEEFFRLTGTGFRDTSRLASGDTTLWEQVFALNRDNVVDALEQFGRHLEALTRAVREDDRTALEEILNRAKKIRDALGS